MQLRLSAIIALLVLSAAPSASCAKDLGVQGTVWPITERDIRELVIESAARADWKDVQKDMKESANSYAGRLPSRTMPVAAKTETRWIDPSIKVDSDIKVPVKQANGEFVWQVLHKAGTTVNPLSVTRPNNAMLFFSGTDREQVALMKRLWAAAPGMIMPIDVSGANVQKLSETAGFPVFYAHDAMLSRFNIDRAPSLLYPGAGDRKLYLGLTTLSRPYRDAAALSAISHLMPSKPVRSR